VAAEPRPAGPCRVARAAFVSQPASAEPLSAPLSVAQEALWYVSRLSPSQISYNETISIRKDGAFDADAFRGAFNEIARRHQAWHTTFDTLDGHAVQVVGPPTSFALPLLDYSRLDPAEAERRAVAIVAEVSRVPYDLRRGPLLRPRLVRFSAEHHRLYLAMHHIVFDGVSVYRVVLPELVESYDAHRAGRPSPLAPPGAEYGDYARWEQAWITSPRVERRLQHWRRHLEPVAEPTLPLDRPRPAPARFSGGVVPVSLPSPIVDRLRGAGQSAGATLFQVLASVWSLLLARYGDTDQVVFATAADLRQRPEFEGVVGYCLTPLVLSVDLSGDPSLTELVVRMRNELLDGLDNLVPFERLVRELSPGGDSSANPIYQTMMVLEPPMATPDPHWSIHQMEGEIGQAVGTTKLDLELELDERPEGHISGRLIYDRDLFEVRTAARLADQWSRLATDVAADPGRPLSRLSIVTAAERRRLLVEYNATDTAPAAAATVGGLVRAAAESDPDAPAVTAGDFRLSYGELERGATRIARGLIASGVRAGDVVAVSAMPSVELVTGVLGVLEAGAAYLLVDPELPPATRDHMVADSGAVTVLVPDAREADLGAPAQRPSPEAGGVIRYVRGERVGVLARHAAVVNAVAAVAAEVGLGRGDAVLVLPSSLYRGGGIDLWLALAAGARIVVAPPEAAGDGARLAALMAAEHVSFLHAAPSCWRTLIDTGLRAVRGLRGLSGGEPLSAELAEEILKRCRVLWHGYDSAETGGYATLGRVQADRRVTLGRPLANNRAYVLDDHGEPVPVGMPGELLVAGAGGAGHYLNRPELTAAAFVAEPFGDGIAYRTGERVRWCEDGTLEAMRLP
jgi:non-ribosomal peptide synthetase component F